MAKGDKVEWLGTGLIGTIEMLGALVAGVRFPNGELIAIGLIGLRAA